MLEEVLVPVFDIFTHLVVGTSDRALLGAEMCRDEMFLCAIIRFAESILTTFFFLV